MHWADFGLLWETAPISMMCAFLFPTLAMLSLSTLLMKLVSGTALLTLIATITDTLTLYLLPNRRTYREIVYEESPDLKQQREDRKQKQEKQE